MSGDTPLTGCTLWVTDRSPEDLRRAQLNIAALCFELWPGEADEAMREILGELGLHRLTGLETYGPNGELIIPAN